MKKLYFLLVFIPLISFGQKTLDFSTYSELSNANLQLVYPSEWTLMNIPGSFYLTSRDEIKLIYNILVWKQEPKLSYNEANELNNFFRNHSLRNEWVKGLTDYHFPNRNVKVKAHTFNLIDNKIHSIRVFIEKDKFVGNNKREEYIYWYFIYNNINVFLGGQSLDGKLSDRTMQILNSITNSIQIN